MEPGTWADWVSGLSTTAAFITTLAIIYRDQRERLTERAEALGSYLMMEHNDERERYQSIALTLTNTGRDEFRNVRLYRVTYLDAFCTGKQRVEVTGQVPSVLPHGRYVAKDVAVDSRFLRGVYAAEFSAMTFRFRGAEWVTYAGEIPRKLRPLSRRRFKARWNEARSTPVDNVIDLAPERWKQVRLNHLD